MKNKQSRNEEILLGESWQYFKDSLNYFYIIALLFLLFAIIGFFPAPKNISLYILEFIKNLFEETSGLNTLGMIIFIFKNNFLASLFGLFLGIIFGIFPIIIAVVNGYLLGFVAKLSIAEEGILSLWKLFPHGIFELPAVFISLGLGLKLGVNLFSKRDGDIFKIIKKSFFIFVLFVVPLLIIAAVIEGLLIFFIK